jgi:hypothetical protein
MMPFPQVPGLNSTPLAPLRLSLGLLRRVAAATAGAAAAFGGPVDHAPVGSGRPSDGGPKATPLPPGTTVKAALDGALVRGADAVESHALGALAAGRRPNALLGWAESAAGDLQPRAAAVTAVLREAGYEPVLRWAETPHEDVVDVLPLPPGMPSGLFTVSRRVALLGSALRRRFVTDYPALGQALGSLVPSADHELYRPEVVPALAAEGGLMRALDEADARRFESVILPLSRVPGANVLVMAGLLASELLDPMEVLNWIGADIHELARSGTPFRPEDVLPLPAPEPRSDTSPGVRYMIFSDTHRDPPVDAEFRIDHFTRNRGLYLRALSWCDENGYTVLENGDCEELWFEPTFDPARRLSKRDRLQRIVDAHQDVYDVLARLEGQGRYYRTMGNHDSYLWEDEDLRAWVAAHPAFPAIHGGFVIDGVKTMDDFLPHIGLDPDAYTSRQAMLLMHGHQFDFWNCDEHNRLGKFIANAIGVVADALDDVAYDFRGIDYQGHPLLETWDVLTPVAPFDNWPPAEIARTWAEAIEQRNPYAGTTQDSLVFSETFASVMAILMRSGDLSPLNFHVLLCLGHTHNPQSRPWIPYLNQFNPWRDTEIAGIRAFERLFSIKTRYLNSGTAGWWEHVVWAIEVTETGQPRLVYWAAEDGQPVPMDWELQDGPPAPGDLDALVDWARQYLRDDVAAALEGLAAADQVRPVADSPGVARIRDLVGAGVTPDLSTLVDLMNLAGTALNDASPGLRRLLSGGLRLTDNRWHQAAVILAARGDRELRGSDPRALPRQTSTRQQPVDLPGLSPVLWPSMLTAADPLSDPAGLDVAQLTSALRDALQTLTPNEGRRQ